MDTNQQPKAAYLAQELKAGKWSPNILQNEVALRQCAAEELLRLYAENETLRKRECLHQIAEPAPVVAQTEALVRYFPGCGSVGTVEGKYRDCCPDGNEARMIPQALAKKCHDTFNIAIDSLLAQPQEAAPVAQAVPAEARQLHGDVRLAHDQCRAVVSLANSVAEVYAARAAIVEHDNSLANQIGQASAAAMEWLGDELNASDAATEEDEWLDPIFDAAQERWPQYAQAALAAVAVPTKVIEALEMLENGALNVAINAKNRGDGYDEGYANAMAKMARETLDLLAATPAADAPTTAAALSRACDLLSSTIGILMGRRAKIAYTDNSPVAALVNEAVEFLRPWPEQMPSSAAAPVVLPESDAVLRFERSTAGKENEMPIVVSCNWLPDGEYKLYTEQQVRAMLATATGLPAQAARTWSCPVRTVADLANNLLTMDQTLPIYGAQYIEHPAGRRRAIAVPPTVSIERVKDSRWIGESDELNAAIIWTRAEQPAAPQALDAEQQAFEDWLALTCPSGDVDSVQRQWEESSDYADLLDQTNSELVVVPKLTPAARDVLAERARQISAEGWTPERDDSYSESELALAAASYASAAGGCAKDVPQNWPWAPEWWKPAYGRRDLEKAGALILAEIERIDRAAIAAAKGE